MKPSEPLQLEKINQFWLMKSEPDVFSIDHLKKDKTTWWEGVRNYQARNYMTQQMKLNDLVLFYHSNAKPSGIIGLAEVSHLALPDKTQFDSKSEYFDAKSTKEKPIWFCTQVKYKTTFEKIISLEEIKQEPLLSKMLVVQKGSRLSIQPVEKNDFIYILKKAKILFR